MSANVELLLNTSSNSGDAVRKDIEEKLSASIKLTKISRVENGEQLMNSIAGIKKRKPKTLVIAGGDGTISSTISALHETDIQYGCIPTGTTNNFARSTNIPQDTDSAIETILNGRLKHVDVGSVNGDAFVNVIGVGVSALIAQNISDKLKKRFGRFAYALVGIRETLAFKPFTVTIHDDDSDLEISYQTRQLIIANGRYHAGTVITEDSDIDTGQLIVFPLGGKNILGFAWAMLSFYFFKRESAKHSSFIHAKNIQLTYSRRVPYELDGEPKIADKMSATAIKKQIEVLC